MIHNGRMGYLIWHQTYLVYGLGSGFSCLIAALPVLTLVILLAVFRKPAWMASPCSLAVAFALATLAYKMPVRNVLSSIAFGATFGLFPILWIIFWAIVLFRVTVETGQFEIIKNFLGDLSPDPRLQALLIAFAFAGFLEGAAGFGTPVAIAGTMLVGLGFSAFNASAVCLLANTAPVAFGSIGIPILTLALTTGLSAHKLGAAAGLICAPIACILPIYLILAMGGMQATRGIWSPMLVAGCVFGGGELAVSTFFGPQLTDIVASLATLIALVILMKARTSASRSAIVLITPPHLPGFTITRADDGRAASSGPEYPQASMAKVIKAWSPYFILVICVLAWGWKPVNAILDASSVSIHWPALDDEIMRMPPIVTSSVPSHAIFALNWLSTPGTACMLATLLSAWLLGMSPRGVVTYLFATGRQLKLPAVTIFSVLGLASLMNNCGATATLGLAFAGTGIMFPFFSTMLGWFGVFLTGSDTSANALFGNLQVLTAERLSLSPVLMAAAGSAGGVMGKMISLQTIAIAAAATGLSQAEQSKLFRFTLRHSVLLATATGAVVMVLTYIVHIT